MMVRRLSLTLALLALASPALADDAPAERPVSQADGAIVVGAVAASLAPMAIRLRHDALWDHQLLGDLDESVYSQFSRRGAQLSDLTLAAALAVPAAYLTGSTIEDADGDRLVLYGETLAIDLAVVQLAKYLVQRPRPYLYNHSPAAVRFAAAAGDDGWASFYSSHAAMSFGAAVAGAYLLSTSNRDPTARAAAWGTGFALAAATSNLRVRAGRHFYSDVALGAVIGAAIGYAVPALHARGTPYTPSTSDAAAAGVGLFAGTVISQLLPIDDPARADHPPVVMVDQLHLGPLAVSDGAGLAISGRVRSRSWGRVPLSRHDRPAPVD